MELTPNQTEVLKTLSYQEKSLQLWQLQHALPGDGWMSSQDRLYKILVRLESRGFVERAKKRNLQGKEAFYWRITEDGYNALGPAVQAEVQETLEREPFTLGDVRKVLRL